MRTPIFIVGPHRTGSTLWHNLIAMSPDVLRLTETRFLSRPGQRDFRFFLKTQVGPLSDDRNVDKLVELCFSGAELPGLEGAFWRFKGIDAAARPEVRKEIARQIKESDRSLGAIARAFFEELTLASGCTRVCVKFPVDVGHIKELFEWFPNGKVIHITRDPRAVAASKSNDPYGTAMRVRRHPRLAWLIRKIMVGLVIGQYWWTARVHRRFEQRPNYRLFRYEDLLANPARTLRELCAFAEIPFTEEMLNPQKGRHEHQASSITGRHEQEFDPASATRWRSAISRTDDWLISFLTRRSMGRLGYDPDTHPVFGLKSR